MKAIIRVLPKPFLALLTVVIFWVVAFQAPWGKRVFYPMHFAVQNKIIPLVYILSFTNLKNENYVPFKRFVCISPLTLAVRQGSKEMIGILLDQGADSELCGSIFYNISHKPEIVRYLIEERKILDTRPDFRSKAFEMIECRNHLEDERARNSAESLRVFLENGTDPNMTRYYAYYDVEVSLLAWAKQYGCTLHSAILREYGADEAAAERQIEEIKTRSAFKRSMTVVHGVSAEFTRKENLRRKTFKRAPKAAHGLSWRLKKAYKNPLAPQK